MWDMLKQFVYDMIHMTEGEKLVYYWPLWLGIAVIGGIFYFLAYRRGGF